MRLPLVSPSLRDVTGLALTFQPDGSWRADFCRINQQRDVVTVAQQGRELSSVESLRDALLAGPVALALVLAGRGVLIRTLPGTHPDQPAAPAEALAAALPGVNLADFYVQYEPISAGTQATLVRKQLLDPLLAEFRANGLWVVSLGLGPFCMAALLPYLPESVKRQPVAAGDFLLHLSAAGDRIEAVDYPSATALTPVVYQVGKETLSGAQVLPYAAALAALVNPEAGGEGGEVVPQVFLFRSEWGYRDLFQRLRLAVPVAILLLMVANLLVSQHLMAERNRLTARLGNNQHLLVEVEQMRATTGLKHRFLTTTGWAQPSWNSLCADRLAASLPPGLDLLSLDVTPLQPLAGGARRQAEFRPDVVTVRGQCRDAQQLNAWLQRLTKLPWVRAVRDQNFSYDYAGGVGTFTFTLVVSPRALLS